MSYLDSCQYGDLGMSRDKTDNFMNWGCVAKKQYFQSPRSDSRRAIGQPKLSRIELVVYHDKSRYVGYLTLRHGSGSRDQRRLRCFNSR
jgi:hypothetical protein